MRATSKPVPRRPNIIPLSAPESVTSSCVPSKAQLPLRRKPDCGPQEVGYDVRKSSVLPIRPVRLY